jgi:hypothetical protein
MVSNDRSYTRAEFQELEERLKNTEKTLNKQSRKIESLAKKAEFQAMLLREGNRNHKRLQKAYGESCDFADLEAQLNQLKAWIELQKGRKRSLPPMKRYVLSIGNPL